MIYHLKDYYKDLPENFLNAHVLICQDIYYKYYNFTSLKAVIIQSEGESEEKESNLLSTADSGAVTLRAEKGEVTYERRWSMPRINETQLKKRLKTEPLGAYLLFGEEQFLVKVYTERLIKATVNDSFSDFNLHIFDSDTVDLSDVYDACVSVPMMSESKCVVVKQGSTRWEEASLLSLWPDSLCDNNPVARYCFLQWESL